MPTVRAVDVPPPPSSVVTKTLPCASTVVSYMPTSSISTMRIDQGAANARMAAAQAASCTASGSRWQAANGRKSRVRPPEWKSSTTSASGTSVRAKKSAIFSVTVPSGRPGNSRFRLPRSMGDVRVPARKAG